jgi:hypothetical protein
MGAPGVNALSDKIGLQLDDFASDPPFCANTQELKRISDARYSGVEPPG